MNNRYLSMLRQVKSTAMATVDAHGMPQVRIIDVMLVRDNALYFCTARGKDFYKELRATNCVAIVGMTKDYQTIRITGEVLHLGPDKDLLEAIFTDNPAMQEVYPHESRYILDVFCVKDASIEFFDLSALPLSRSYDALGTAKVLTKGFLISNACIFCGQCADICPQKCILPSETQYVITQGQCLHCGLCAENCPENAIKRL